MDVGGVTLLRAAAKNHIRVSILSDPKDYATVIAQLKAHNKVSDETRQLLALKAFNQTSEYDEAISNYLRQQYASGTQQLTLRYGANPHQKPAQVFIKNAELPIKGKQRMRAKGVLLNTLPGFEFVYLFFPLYPAVFLLWTAGC